MHGGIVGGLSSTVNIGLLTWGGLLFLETRIVISAIISVLRFTRLLASPPRMRGRVGDRSSLTHNEPVLRNILHLLLTLSHLNLL